jgi:hypothetical protein
VPSSAARSARRSFVSFRLAVATIAGFVGCRLAVVVGRRARYAQRRLVPFLRRGCLSRRLCQPWTTAAFLGDDRRIGQRRRLLFRGGLLGRCA